MLCFTNRGEIDPRLITTLGVNVKEGASPIGHFGTGLKYAIAISLRLGAKLTIHAGETTLRFAVKPAALRGKEFGFIEMEAKAPGQPPSVTTLGFTTELGKHWQPWMAYREFLCNARDERGAALVLTREPKPCADITRVLIENETLETIHAEPKPWLLAPTQAPIWSTPTLAAYPGESLFGFYRGIKVVEFSRPTLFTYNLLAEQTLTEDRTLDYYTFTGVVTREIFSSEKPEIPPHLLRSVVAPSQTHAEAGFYWPSYLTPRAELLDLPNLSANVRDAVARYLPPKAPSRTLYDDLKADAPPVPPHTCPLIDEVLAKLSDAIGLINGVHAAATEAGDTTAANRLANALALIEEVAAPTADEGLLEQLREANAALRESGIYWRQQAARFAQNVPSTKAEEVSDAA